MNRLYSVGFIYVILRDIGTKNDPIMAIGFMRQTGAPWKTGKGLQLRFGKYILQVGFCKTNKQIKDSAEENGLLYAVKGRLLEDTPDKIGSW